MSCHIGFEDLTESRRRALIRLLQRVESRPTLLRSFIQFEFRRQQKRLLVSPAIKNCINGYEQLSRQVLAQFPETRWELVGTDDCEPRTNRQLLRQLATLDAIAADRLNVPAGELADYFAEREYV